MTLNLKKINPIDVKFCGLTSVKDINLAASMGARYAGFVFFEKSPRSLTFEMGRKLALEAPIGLAKVALVVNPKFSYLDELISQVPIDMIQLHGSESPKIVHDVRKRYGLPVMKAIGISSESDLKKVKSYCEVCDQILFDAKPSSKDALPGGNGLQFDWSVLANKKWSKPWMLAGGLNAANVEKAVKVTNARQLDLSSSIELSPGIKDPEKIQDFMQALEQCNFEKNLDKIS